MASNENRTQSETLQYFWGGEGVPEDVVRRRLLDFHEKKMARLRERTVIALEATKYLSEAQKSAQSAAGDTQARLLETHKKLAERKLAPPVTTGGPGGIVAGRITVTTAPPYHYDQVIPMPDQDAFEPILKGSADKDTGQMSSSAATAWQPGKSGGSVSTLMGMVYQPKAAGTLTAYVNPIYSFVWWTESYFPAVPAQHAENFFEGALSIIGYPIGEQPTPPTIIGQQIPTTIVVKPFVYSDEQQIGSLVIKDGFNLQASATVSTYVDPSQVYYIYASAATGVWTTINNIAGAMLAVTVPSITYEFETQPVIQL